MIDLKELDKKVDPLLAKETPESLEKWLINHRIKRVMSKPHEPVKHTQDNHFHTKG
jgi:hypothetical protein